MYADSSYYKSEYEGSIIPDTELNHALKKASMHIDTLTFNRIVGRGFEHLTPFQKDKVRMATCMLAEFEYENCDFIENILQSYSINGVSASFGQNWNVHIQSGVAIKKDAYALLQQTGLCYPGLGV